jgi:hypothetical protein
MGNWRCGRVFDPYKRVRLRCLVAGLRMRATGECLPLSEVEGRL